MPAGYRQGLGPHSQHCLCYELETAYEASGAHDVGNILSLPSPMACQNACKKNAECRFWSYQTMEHPHWPGLCTFKTRGQEKIFGLAYFISGPRICPHIAP